MQHKVKYFWIIKNYSPRWFNTNETGLFDPCNNLKGKLKTYSKPYSQVTSDSALSERAYAKLSKL